MKWIILGLTQCVLVAAVGAKQITVSARFIEGKAGSEDILSAPRVTMLENQDAQIEIVREVLIGDKLGVKGDHIQTAETGISMKVVGTVVGDDVVLRGTMRHSELEPKVARDTARGAWVGIRSGESVFVLKIKSGEMREMTVPSLSEKGVPVRVELTVDVIDLPNAATLYWRAFAQLPPQPAKNDTKAMAEWAEQSKGALGLMHEAVRSDECDWGTDFAKGPAAELPHVGKAMKLSRAAVARAKKMWAVEPAAANADLWAALQVGADVGTEELLISQLVRVAIEGQVLELAESKVDALSADARAEWRKVVDGLPKAPTLAELVAFEGEMMVNYMRDHFKKEAGVTFEELLGDAAKGLDTSEKAVRKMVESLERDYEEVVRIAALPSPLRKAKMDTLFNEWKADKKNHILSLVVVPAIDSAGKKFDEAAARMEAFRKKLD